MSRLRKEFELKLNEARCRAENCLDENAILNNRINNLQKELNDEEAAQKRAEQDAEKLRLTLRFERDLHRQEMKEICKRSKIHNQRQQFQISEKYKAQLIDSLNNLRGQLEDQLRLNHLNFNDQMKNFQGPTMNTDMGGGAMSAIISAQNPLISTNAQIADLEAKLSDCSTMVNTLESQIKYWVKILENDKTQVDNLQKTIKELCIKYQNLLDDKVKIQIELDAYNEILKGEEKRLNVTDMCDAIAKEMKDAAASAGRGGGNRSGSDDKV